MSEEIKFELTEREAKVIITDCKCSKCKEGIMIGSNQAIKGKIDQSKMFVLHKCNKCGDVKQFENIKFPKVDFFPIDVYNKRIEDRKKCSTCENSLETGECETKEPEKCLNNGYEMYKEKKTNDKI